MKHRLAFTMLLMAVAGCSASTGLYSDKSFSETHPCFTDAGCTDAAPSFFSDGGAPGVSLLNVDGFRLAICANQGQTLASGGIMQAWYCDHKSQLCYHNAQLDQSQTGSGSQCIVFADFKSSFITEETGDNVEFIPVGISPNGATDGGLLTKRIYMHSERYK